MASANVANTLVVPLASKVSPFYDDFDESKNFQRILFRPGYAVQARELTQIQTILQNQIERFGRHIFVNGSSVVGGKIDISDVITLNLATQYANSDIVVANFKDKTIKYSNGNNDVIARVVQVSPATTTSPPALHVKYITGQEFGPGSTIQTTTGNVFANLVSSANVSSNGQVSFIYDSIYFYSGYFIKVPTQAIVLSKHTRTPTLRVGLELQESIVTESDDSSLLDPALEASNYQAPGAARYRTDLVYTTRSTTSTDDEKFIQIGKIENGVITEKVSTPVYSEIEEVLARRTYDESGNYIVSPFTLTIEDSPTDPANNFLLNISSGKAYLFGYETERQSSTKIELPRARDKANKTNYDLNLNYGNYVIVEDLKGVFNTQGLGIIDLHCVAQSAVNVTNTTTYNSTKIGTARVRDIEFYSGSSNVTTRQFEYYFFDTKFRTITGTGASTANSNTEIVLQANNTSKVDDAYTGAWIKINSGLGSGDFREIASYDGPNNRAAVYNAFTQITGANTQYTITFDITDVDSFAQNVSYTTGATSNATATIAPVSKDNGLLTGNTYISEPNRQASFFVYPEKFIAPGITNESYVYRRIFTGVQFVGGTSAVITAGTNEDFEGATGANTASTVMENFLVIVTDKQSSSRVTGEQVKVSADVTSSTPEQATLSTGGGGSDSFLATVYAKMSTQDSGAQHRVKTLIKANTQYLTTDAVSNVFVGSTGSTANVYVNAGQVVIMNPSKQSSVIESLYLSDVISVPKIYAFPGNTAPVANTKLSSFLDVTERYEFDNGQRLTHYDHAAIRLKPGYAPISGGLVVCCRAFKTTNDSGYFSVDSYPSLSSIVTEEGVSLGTGYSLIPTFRNIRLSDVIDFRPVRNNASNTENFSFNTSRTPVPATDFRSSYSYYLPRRDIVSLNLNQNIQLLQGDSAINPVFPKEPDRNLTLHRLSLNPYTIKKNDVIIETVDHRRYTMQDIAAIDRRLKNVEYSVSLNSLERKATDTVIQDVDGLDRTKYGILADTFNSFLLSDPSAPDFSAAIDTTGKYSGVDGMLMPKLHGNYFALRANTATADTVSYHDDKVMLAYTTRPVLSQTFATKTTPVAEYLYADFRGQLITFPDSDIWKDTTVLDPIVISLPPSPPKPDDPKPEPPKTCFTGESLVLMADGTQKRIDEVVVGEKVLAYNNEIVEVAEIETPVIGERGLVSINGSKAFATADHIFKSKDNLWLVADIEQAKVSFPSYKDIVSKGGVVKQMEVGDVLDTENGFVTIESFIIVGKDTFDETTVYDLCLKENHVYYVNGFAVHNCSPYDPPPDVVINGNVIDVGPQYEMLMMLLDSNLYGGLGALLYDAATGKYYPADGSPVVINGVTQTAGITFEQAANYVEAVLNNATGSTVNITASNVQFIAEVYNDLLNRPPEGAGLAYWAELYASGNYTEQEMYQLIVDGAIASGEILQLPDDYNISVTPSVVVSQDDFNYSIAAGLNTTSYDGLTATNYSDLLADDNLTRENTVEEVINDLYQSYLGRDAEAAGLEYWVNVYNEQGAEAAVSQFYDTATAHIEAGLEQPGSGFDPIGGNG